MKTINVGDSTHTTRQHVAVEDVEPMLNDLLANFLGNYMHSGVETLKSAKEKLLKEKL